MSLTSLWHGGLNHPAQKKSHTWHSLVVIVGFLGGSIAFHTACPRLPQDDAGIVDTDAGADPDPTDDAGIVGDPDAGSVHEVRTAVPFNTDAQRRIQSLANLAAPVTDHTNHVADDENAAVLGQFFFYDQQLSIDGTISCASCHKPDHGFTDDKALSVGVPQINLPRHTPTVINAAYQRWQFWDGRADSLWSQALGPIESGKEMGFDRAAVYHRIRTEPTLLAAYQKIFGDFPVFLDENQQTVIPLHARPAPEDPEGALATAWNAMSPEQQDAVNLVFSRVGKSIAAYERKIISRDSRFDRFAQGLQNQQQDDVDALTASEQRGLQLFVGDAHCYLCHNGKTFTDREFHNIGLPPINPSVDFGRLVGVDRVLRDPFNALGKFSDDTTGPEADRLRFLTGAPEQDGQFKTGSLRDISKTPPYMHDGRFATLRDVINFYNDANGVPARGHREEVVVPLNLSDEQKSDLEAFLRSLDGQPLADALLHPLPLQTVAEKLSLPAPIVQHQGPVYGEHPFLLDASGAGDSVAMLGAGTSWGIVLADTNPNAPADQYVRVCEESFGQRMRFAWRAPDGRILVGGGQGVLITRDGGCTYGESLPELAGQAVELLTQPLDHPEQLFLVTSTAGANNGVWVSKNEGLSFTPTGLNDVTGLFTSLTVSDDGQKIAATGIDTVASKAFAFVSEDGGTTWERFDFGWPSNTVVVRAHMFTDDGRLLLSHFDDVGGHLLLGNPITEEAEQLGEFTGDITDAVVYQNQYLVIQAKSQFLRKEITSTGDFVVDLNGPRQCLLRVTGDARLYGCGHVVDGGHFLLSNDGITWESTLPFTRIVDKECPVDTAGYNGCAYLFDPNDGGVVDGGDAGGNLNPNNDAGDDTNNDGGPIGGRDDEEIEDPDTQTPPSCLNTSVGGAGSVVSGRVAFGNVVLLGSLLFGLRMLATRRATRR